MTDDKRGLTPKIRDAAGAPLADAAGIDSAAVVGTIRDRTRDVALAADRETAGADAAPATAGSDAVETPGAVDSAAQQSATKAPEAGAVGSQTPAPGANASESQTPATVTYAQAGVDIEEGARAVEAYKDAVRSTTRPEAVGGLGGFGGLFSIAAAKTMADPLLVSGTDGVGTKLALAQRLGKNDTVGIDLVAMCANDILTCGAEPLFFLDYLAIGHLEAATAATIVGGIAEGCRQAGCALIGGETAEHPGVMAPDDYDLSGFCVGLIDRPAMITDDLVADGDVVIGLASSGFHSNGYSLVRKVCVENATDEELRAPRPELEGRSLAETLLAPTRIYVKVVQALLDAHRAAIHGIAHITGGGITENLNRALPKDLDALVTLGSWTVPPVIRYVCEAAHLPADEALKTFNMGIGLALIVDAAEADAMLQTLGTLGEPCFKIGTIVPGTGVVRYEGALKL